MKNIGKKWLRTLVMMLILVNSLLFKMLYSGKSHMSISSVSWNENTLSHKNDVIKDVETKHRAAKNFTVALCAIVKDAEAYFMEWIDYNLLGLEFDHIYIYDNSENFDLQRWVQNTRQHPDYYRVEVEHYPNGSQMSVYNECVKNYGKGGPLHDYIAFLDYDEFIVLQQPHHDNIHDLLEEYLVPFGGALVINWLYLGSANRTVYSPVPITKRFQYTDEEALVITKSITKSSDFVTMVNAHAVEVKKDASIYDTSSKGSLVMPGNAGNAGSNINKPMNVALIYHYRFMSEKEFLFKQCWRKNIGDKKWGCNESTGSIDMNVPKHLQSRVGTVFDDKAWKFLVRKVPKYKMYDQDEWKDNF